MLSTILNLSELMKNSDSFFFFFSAGYRYHKGCPIACFGVLPSLCCVFLRMMWAAGAVAAMSSITFPAISAIVSRNADPDQQGKLILAMCISWSLIGKINAD